MPFSHNGQVLPACYFELPTEKKGEGKMKNMLGGGGGG